MLLFWNFQVLIKELTKHKKDKDFLICFFGNLDEENYRFVGEYLLFNDVSRDKCLVLYKLSELRRKLQFFKYRI